MEAYSSSKEIMEILPNPKKKNPVLYGYALTDDKLQPLVVLGKYTTGCGGLDSWSWKGAHPWMYDQMKRWNAVGYNVLCEGITVGADRTRIGGLVKDGYNAEAIILDTPLARCIDSVQSRRAERGQPPLEDTHRIVSKYRSVELSPPFWTSYNVPWNRLNRDEAVSYLLKSLAVNEAS